MCERMWSIHNGENKLVLMRHWKFLESCCNHGFTWWELNLGWTIGLVPQVFTGSQIFRTWDFHRFSRRGWALFTPGQNCCWRNLPWVSLMRRTAWPKRDGKSWTPGNDGQKNHWPTILEIPVHSFRIFRRYCALPFFGGLLMVPVQGCALNRMAGATSSWKRRVILGRGPLFTRTFGGFHKCGYPNIMCL